MLVAFQPSLFGSWENFRTLLMSYTYNRSEWYLKPFKNC